MKYTNYLGILLLVIVIVISGCKTQSPTKSDIPQPERNILKIEIKYGGFAEGGPIEGDDRIIFDIQNNQISTTVYDGFDKTKFTTSTADYNFDQIYSQIEDLVEQNELTLDEYKGSEDCIVYDASPGYVIVYFKDKTIKVEQDFCNKEKPYAFFNGISNIHRNIQKEISDPFAQPQRGVSPNCGPEYRYQYDVEKSLTSVEEVISFLEDVRAIPLPADFFSKNKDNFIKSNVENGKLIFTLNTLGLPTRDCFDGYEEIVVSDIGEISFYSCCGK